jgi:8-oxo-dGTP diphosphatase
MPRSYPDRPYVGIGVVVFKDDQVLLVQRAKPPIRHNWSIPGGAQDIGETVREGALRELKEETALDADIIGLIDVVDSVNRDDDGKVQFHYTLVDFAAEWTAGEAAPDTDVAAVRWVPIAEIEAQGLWHETVRIINRAVEMRNR